MDRHENRQQENSQESGQANASPRSTLIAGVAAAALGLFVLLVGLGVVPVDPRSVHAPYWIVAAAGTCFLLAGISVAAGAVYGVSETGELPKDAGWWTRLFYYAVAVVIAGALASIGSWVAFGPGLRGFNGPGLFLLSPEAGDLVGRVVFGFGAVLTWLITIALAVGGARKLFRKPT